jgi:hypothetical protein
MQELINVTLLGTALMLGLLWFVIKGYNSDE